MGAYTNGIHMNGNFNKLSESKPKNWIDTGYKIIVPYKFEWRHKIGKVECNCTFCEQYYQPYCGVQWYHSKDCALMIYIDLRPSILNLKQYYGQDLTLIAEVE